MATHPSGAPWRDRGSDHRGPRLFAHRGRTVSSAFDLGAAGGSGATGATLVRDKNLLDHWQAGDAEAGVALLDHYAGFVRRVALRLGVPGGEFEEFWQDLVLRLVQQLPHLHERLRTSFAGYLAWQVRDLVRNWRRRARTIAPPPFEPVARVEDAAAAFWRALA